MVWESRVVPRPALELLVRAWARLARPELGLALRESKLAPRRALEPLVRAWARQASIPEPQVGASGRESVQLAGRSALARVLGRPGQQERARAQASQTPEPLVEGSARELAPPEEASPLGSAAPEEQDSEPDSLGMASASRVSMVVLASGELPGQLRRTLPLPKGFAGCY